jgi:hypothetical protein
MDAFKVLATGNWQLATGNWRTGGLADCWGGSGRVTKVKSAFVKPH